MLGHVRSASEPTLIVTVDEHQRFHPEFGEQYLRWATNSGTLVLSHAGTDVQIFFLRVFLQMTCENRGEIGKKKEKRVRPSCRVDSRLTNRPLRMLGADVLAQRNKSCLDRIYHRNQSSSPRSVASRSSTRADPSIPTRAECHCTIPLTTTLQYVQDCYR